MENYDNKSLIYPELKLVNIVLAFFKTQFFIRIYDRFSLLVEMLKECLFAIIPFLTTYIFFVLLYSTFFVILEAEIDPEVAEAQIENYFCLMILQVFRTSTGELAMPGYKKLLKT